MSEDITRHDQRRRRCPRLGHDIHFGYCRSPGAELPCRRVFDCWWESFNVEGFIRRHYSEQDIENILRPRTDKLTSILEILQKARRAHDDKGDESSC